MILNTCTVSSGSASSTFTARKALRQSRLVLARTGVAVISRPYLIILIVRLSDGTVLSRGGMQKTPKHPEKRRYSGQSFADRHAERRDKLVKAAAMVASRSGFDGTSVAAICAEAGLTARYFYESFPSREAIFVEAYRGVQNELLNRLQAAPSGGDTTKRALTGFFSAIK